MPSKSKSQQKFMGMVHQCKKTGKCASKEVADTAKSIKDKDAKDFASTKHKGLPDKKKVKESRDMKVIKENYGFRKMLQQVVETPIGTFKVVGGLDREWEEYQIWVLKQNGNRFEKIPNSMQPSDKEDLKNEFDHMVKYIEANPEQGTTFHGESNNMKKVQNKLMVEFINNICEKNYSAAKNALAGVVDEKIKGRIKKTAENINDKD